jgi:hypothetical protein
MRDKTKMQHDQGQGHPDRASLKRVAIQVVSLLPTEETDALAVLDFAKDLVTKFLGAEPVPERPKLVSSRRD